MVAPLIPLAAKALAKGGGMPGMETMGKGMPGPGGMSGMKPPSPMSAMGGSMPPKGAAGGMKAGLSKGLGVVQELVETVTNSMKPKGP